VLPYSKIKLGFDQPIQFPQIDLVDTTNGQDIKALCKFVNKVKGFGSGHDIYPDLSSGLFSVLCEGDGCDGTLSEAIRFMRSH